MSVADEAGYRAALTSLSGDSSGPHVIEVAADIVLAGSADPVYTGTQPLTINGNGFTIDGDGNSRIVHVVPPSPVAVDLALNDLTVTNGSAATGAGVAGPGAGVEEGSDPVVAVVDDPKGDALHPLDEVVDRFGGAVGDA